MKYEYQLHDDEWIPVSGETHEDAVRSALNLHGRARQQGLVEHMDGTYSSRHKRYRDRRVCVREKVLRRY